MQPARRRDNDGERRQKKAARRRLSPLQERQTCQTEVLCLDRFQSTANFKLTDTHQRGSQKATQVYPCVKSNTSPLTNQTLQASVRLAGWQCKQSAIVTTSAGSKKLMDKKAICCECKEALYPMNRYVISLDGSIRCWCCYHDVTPDGLEKFDAPKAPKALVQMRLCP